MTSQTKTVLKSYFNTGDVPTEAQFASLIDTIGGVTLIVAASNAPDASKGRADYVCDGVGDQVEIQAAIDALPSVGGRVLLTEGLFTIADAGSGFSIQIARSNVRLTISSGATIKLRDNEISGTETCNLIRIGDGSTAYSNILIDGKGVVDGNVSNNPSTGTITTGAAVYIYGPNTKITLSELTIQNSTRDAVFVAGAAAANRASNIHIKNCTINNCAEGIVWTRANYVWVCNNVITNTTEQDGIEPTDDCSYWWIVGNYFSGIAVANTAIDVFSNTNSNKFGIIAGNFIINNGATYDVSIGYANSGPVSDIVFTENVLDGGGMIIGDGAIAAGTLTNILIANNIIRDGDGHGISVGEDSSVVTIVGNSISGFAFNGVKTYVAGVEICDNQIYNNGKGPGAPEDNRAGIWCANVANTRIANNSIYDSQVTATQSRPITANAANGTVIIGNYFSGHETSNNPSITGSGLVLAHNNGWVTENDGAAANTADGGTIAHGCASAPTVVQLTPSIAGEMATVTSIDATNITVAIKKHDGTAGTAQTVYWRSWV